MFRQLSRIPPTIAIFLFTAAGFAGDDPTGGDNQSAREILAGFKQRNPDWKVRMRSIVQLARAGADARPILLEALRSGSTSQRQFAAQTLAMIQDPAAQPELVRALSDKDAIVRNYVVRALGMMRSTNLTPSERKRVLRSLGSTSRRYASKVLLKHRRLPEWKSVRQTLTKYDLKKLDSARVGKPAPDFELYSADGKTYRLRQFRGKKIVVLEFNSAFW